MLLQFMLYCLLLVIKDCRTIEKNELSPQDKSVLESVTHINKEKCRWYLQGTHNSKLTLQLRLARIKIDKLLGSVQSGNIQNPTKGTNF